MVRLRHIPDHLAGPLKRIIASEQSLQAEAMSVTPVLFEMRRLNLHTQKTLGHLRSAKDWPTVLDAIRQLQSGIEVPKFPVSRHSES